MYQMKQYRLQADNSRNMIHSILRHFQEKTFKFRIKLCCQSFIVAQNQCRLVQVCYDIGYGKGFARSRNA